MNCAVIWGNHRNDLPFTVHHMFFEATLRDRGIQFDRYLWSEWQNMPRKYDLYFFIDWHPSLFQLSKYPYHPRVLYWWDSFHYTFVYLSELLQQFDHCYLSEYPTVKGLSDYKNVSWLPSAFYPGVYRPLKANKCHDYAFIGQFDDVVTRYGLTRKEFILKLSQSNLHGYVGQGIYGERVNQVYNESKILFDWTIANNLGTRFFETIGSGGFLLMNKCLNNGIEQVAQDGVHYISYDSYNDFEQKVRFYLEHDAEREKISFDGYNHFLANHTYSNRLDVILKDFKLDSVPNIISSSKFDNHQERLPVYINNRNRLTYMQQLIDWLCRIPYVDIIILDNDSTYQPLLDWYNVSQFNFKIIKLGRNVGHHALWEYPLNGKQIPFNEPGEWFVYTDPDLLPIESCPLEAFQYMREIMLRNLSITKVGFGIEISDLPDHYPLKKNVQEWEGQYWTPDKRVQDGFRANTDTTMCLYNKHRVSKIDLSLPPPHFKDVVDIAIRCDYPYVSRHLPWYVDVNNLSDEEKFFMSNAAWYSSWTHVLTSWMKNTNTSSNQI